MTYFLKKLVSFLEIGWVLMESTISVRLWHKTCGEPRTLVPGTFEREIHEKDKFVHQSTVKKTLPAWLAWHVQSKQMQSLFKISTTGSLFSYIGKSWYPTGLARNNGSSTAEIVTYCISCRPLRKPSPSQLKSHEDCDSLILYYSEKISLAERGVIA